MNTGSPAALLSVSDKTGLAAFAKRLVEAGYTLVSTGGTARHLREAGLEVMGVASVTGFPEILGGRVKTLHPKIHGGLLAKRDDPDHLATMDEHGILDFRIVAVNLYPFAETVAREGSTLESALEQIDIGGPTMVRAAAKNHGSMSVIVCPDDYDAVSATLPSGPDLALRRRLAQRAFRHTADYDVMISEYLDTELGGEEDSSVVLRLTDPQPLRYGENPHQAAKLFRLSGNAALGGYNQIHGKDLSYNNLIDLDAALALVAEFSEPSTAIIKHTNPAGCATGTDLLASFQNAHRADPMSAFGGIIALNRAVDIAVASEINEHFFEIVCAPSFDDEALEVLRQKKNLRIITAPQTPVPLKWTYRHTLLGVVAQEADPVVSADRTAWTLATATEPTEEQWDGLAFAWRVCKHVKSNAIVFAKGTRTLGVGAGQMSRVDAVDIATSKCRESSDGAVMASDAFFPFRDGVDKAAAAGIKAIVQPGGSRRDAEVVAACDEHGIAMVFTGQRHFRH